MSNQQLTPKQQKGCGIGCLSVAGIIAIILFGAFIMDSFNNNKKDNAADKSLDTSLAMEERLKFAVIGALGEENNMGDPRNVTVENISNAYVITFLADDSSSQVRTLELNIIDVMEAIKPIDGLEALIIRAQNNFIDKYGNNVVDNGLNVSIQKSEIDKINFENFYSTQLKNITLYNLHPALAK